MRRVLVAVAVLGMSLVTALPAQACSCADWPLDRLIADAAVVFVGSAVDRTEVPNGVMPVQWTFEVERYLKGSGDPQIVVGTGVGSGDCGVDFSRLGRTAVLTWPDRGLPTTNSCGGVWDADEVIALTGQGTAPEAAAPPPAAKDERPARWPWVAGGSLLLLVVAVGLVWRSRRVARIEVDGWNGRTGGRVPPS